MAAVAAKPLTAGAILNIYETRDTTGQPVLQIVSLRRLATPADSAAVRFRLAVSDGTHFQQAMLATQLNRLVSDRTIVQYSVVRVNDFVVQDVAGQRILIILNLTVVDTEGSQLGSPIGVDTLGVAKGSPASTAASSGTAAPAGAAGRTPSSSGILAMLEPRPGSASGGVPLYRDIQTINPYQSGWTIRGRCTYKSDLRTFQNPRGEGQVVSFELTDKSGSIRITAFTDRAAEVVAKVKAGKVYSVSRAQLRQANERYNKSTSPFEMTLDSAAVLRETVDDGSVTQIRYHFTKVADLEQLEGKAACDVLAVVHEIGDLTEIVIRSTAEPCVKRTLILVDDSNATVELTLWRREAETLVTEADREGHPILLLRNAVRGDFGGVCLSTSRSTMVDRDPSNVPEAKALREWYDAGGAQAGVLQPLSAGCCAPSGKGFGDRTALQDAREQDVTAGLSSGRPVQFSMRGYVMFAAKDRELSYPSDPSTKKRVSVSGAPGVWHSESSGRDFTDDEIVHRYLCSLKIGDFSGGQWMQAFDEGGQVVFGRTAGEMRGLRGLDRAMYDRTVDDCLFRPLVLRISVKEDNYGGENRVRYTIGRCERANFVTESRALLAEIAAYRLSPS
jgi:replication factor A1